MTTKDDDGRRRRDEDRVAAAHKAHADEARAMGLCPRLHELDDSGNCPECTGPIPTVDLPQPRRNDGAGPPVLIW
jgi:hypothetical protein